ncbi:protease HtpX [Clostridiales bacterium PH28_bin88]|nr:protease HtpX [Clostridiales bacterium PH28_bin88]
MGNSFKPWLLMGILSILLVVMGKLIGGQGGMMVFLLIAVLMNFAGYWFSDRIAIKMTGSQPLAEQDAPELYAMVRRLCRQAGLPMPKLYITPSLQPNAFATGRDPHHASIAVTQGLLQALSQEELEGVLAHELAHIKNRDILIGSLAAMVAGAITMIANTAQWALMFGFGRREDEGEGGSPLGLLGSLLMIIVAPLAATLIQMAISRSREFYADEAGAGMAGNSRGLAQALLKLERASAMMPMDVNPAAAHMFIVNPLAGESLLHLFSTHPPISERVSRLRRMKFDEPQEGSSSEVHGL